MLLPMHITYNMTLALVVILCTVACCHSAVYRRDGLRELIQSAFALHESQAQRIDAFEAQALKCVANKERVFIFEVQLHGDQDTSLDVIILDAVIQTSKLVVVVSPAADVAQIEAADAPRQVDSC